MRKPRLKLVMPMALRFPLARSQLAKRTIRLQPIAYHAFAPAARMEQRILRIRSQPTSAPAAQMAMNWWPESVWRNVKRPEASAGKQTVLANVCLRPFARKIRFVQISRGAAIFAVMPQARPLHVFTRLAAKDMR